MTDDNLDKVDSKLTDRGTVKKPIFSDNMNCHTVLDFADVTVMVVRITTDLKYWIVGLRNGVIQLFPTRGNQQTPSLTLQVAEENTACVDINAVPSRSTSKSEKNHRILAAYASGYVRIWCYTGANLNSRLLAAYREERIYRPNERTEAQKDKVTYNQILACSCSPDAERFVTGGDDSHIRVYEMSKKSRPRICCSSFNRDKTDGHIMRICALKYHPRGAEDSKYAHIFVSGGWDDTVHVWDDRKEHSLWVYAGPHISGSDGLDIEPVTNDILTSSWRHDTTLLQIWNFSPKNTRIPLAVEGTSAEIAFDDLGSGCVERPVMEVPQESLEMRSKGYVARWIGENYFAFGGSGGNIVRIIGRINQKTFAHINDFPSGVFSMEYIPYLSGTSKKPIRLAFASGSQVYLVNMDPK